MEDMQDGCCLNFEITNSNQCYNRKTEISSLEKKLLEQGFFIPIVVMVNCHESLFESVLKLAMLSNGKSARKAIFQTFYNYFISNENRSIK